MISFYLDKGSGLPTYVQLVQQVKQALRLGLLRTGDQLPTASEVVDQLAINPNTVLKAYRELDREGLVVARPGQGTFVAQTLGDAPATAYRALRRDLTRCVRTAHAAGLDVEDIRAVFTAVMHETSRGQVA
ncbi:MAG TPA: GntR family transcriptional regulator [Micromonosporaceae bacterium]|jgi:GntR family transcriptional regulator|nr:GntR family transcriptional regulator [Micromonosporaceae bacterium]